MKLNDTDCKLKYQKHLDFYNNLLKNCDSVKKTRFSDSVNKYEFTGCDMYVQSPISDDNMVKIFKFDKYK